MKQSIESSILHAVEADAKDRLANAIRRHKLDDAKQALREIVETKLPDPRMPKKLITRVIPGIGGASIAWRWVAATGTVTLVADVTTSWESIVLCVFISYPGLSNKPQVMFRDVVVDPKTFDLSLDQAIRQMINLGLLHP